MTIKRSGVGIENIIKKIKDLDKLKVYVGVPASKNEMVGDINMATLAAVHEFGATIKHGGGTRYQKNGNGNLAKFVRNDFVGPTSGITKAHTIVVPERSYIRTTLKENRDKYVELFEKGSNSYLSGKYSAEDLYNRLGLTISNDIKDRMVSGEYVPLSPMTIKKKGSSKPLVDTGELRNSITWEVK